MLRRRTQSSLRRRDTAAHVDGDGGVRERTDGDEVDTGLGVRADVLEGDAAGAFDGDTLFELAAAVNGFANVVEGHVIEQQSFGAVCESFLDLFEGADFNFDRLGAAAIAMRAIERRVGSKPAD